MGFEALRGWAAAVLRGVIGIGLLHALAGAQNITQAQRDSGWVPVFDGKSLDGFYSILGGDAPNNDLVKKPDGTFSFRASDSSIHATGSPTAHIVTKKLFSHYRVRMRERFDNAGNPNQNAGMLYHVQIDGPRLFGAFPRSIEYQGQKRGMGEIWTIGNVYVNTTVDSTKSQHQFKLGGKMVTHGNPDGRQCLGSSVPYVDNAWNTMEATIRGSDSASHYVNGVLVFKSWKMRWSEKDDPKDMAHMLAQGSIAFQSEGVPVSYRDFMVMELDPATGRPINAKPVLAQAFAPAERGNLLRAENGDGGLIIRYAIPAAVRSRGEAGRLSILALDGRVLDRMPLAGASGQVLWTGTGRAAGPIVIREDLSGQSVSGLAPAAR